MDEKLIGEALIELADLSNCASGDFHCLHLNVQGAEFDNIHGVVLKKYYEEAAYDYDELAEKSRMFDITSPSPNESATRIGYQSFNPQNGISKDIAISRSNEVMELILDKYLAVYKSLNKIDDCPMVVGIANFLQTRLEYWSKECHYFNKSRGTS